MPQTGGLVAAATADLVPANQILQSKLIANSTPTLNFQSVTSNTFTVESLNSQNNHDIEPNLPNVIQQHDSNSDETLCPTATEYVECISMLKCKLCGFVSSSYSGMDNHLFDEHDKEITISRLHNKEDWQHIAKKKGVQLNCPMCQNVFNSEKSFKFHLTEDHNMSESLALSSVKKENYIRKNQTLNIIRTEKERLREERKINRQHSFEAYLDTSGELRIRRIAKVLENELGQVTSLNPCYIDCDQKDVIKDYKDMKGILDIKASDYADFITKKVDGLDGKLKKSDLLINKENRSAIKVLTRPKTGRPKGSKNLGISKIRKINPQITISDNMMGYECGVDGCAVRLKVYRVNPQRKLSRDELSMRQNIGISF